MSKEQFIDKWRKQYGCKNTGSADVCWCEVCTKLEKIWYEEREKAIARATDILEQHARSDVPGPKQDALKEVIKMLKMF